MKGYYLITDENLSAAGIVHDAGQAIAERVRLIQYRNKSAATRILFEEALELKRMCAGSSTRLIINDRVDIALAVDADGVHIGQDDLPYDETRRLLGKDKLIGITVHTLQEACQAEAQGADYLGVSPIYATNTKTDAGQACGLETLRAIRQTCRKPIVAIGGITLTNLAEVLATGADMVCAISAVVTKPDVAAEIRLWQKEFTV
ncbi:MAG: thiamine phosphate synthase [Syntrophaceae bacterium]